MLFLAIRSIGNVFAGTSDVAHREREREREGGVVLVGYEVWLTFGVCDLTLPARARDPWTFPMILRPFALFC